MRLAILTTHPVQYYAPLFRYLASRIDVHVYFAYRATPAQQADAGFGTAFEWDIDLTSGYTQTFLNNVAKVPSASTFAGCDTPDIGDLLRQGHFDGVLTLGWHVKSLLQGVLAAKRRGLPVLVRGDSQLATPRSRLKKWSKAVTYPVFLRLFDAALPVGTRNRAYYEHYFYPRERMFSSPHCVDTQRFAIDATPAAREAMREELFAGPETKLVLFAGKLVAFKRPLDVIDAVAKVRRSGIDARVVVAGAGILSEAMDTRARASGVPLVQLGFQNQSSMPRIYAAADALVLPSTARETWGLVCNEALASGTPVVVSDAAGCAPDIAQDAIVGRTFPLGDVDACSSRLRSLFQSPPSKVEIQAFAERFSIPSAAEGILSALETVCRSARK